MLRLMCGWDLDTSWSLWCFMSWVRRKNQFEFVVTFVCDASPGFASPIRIRKFMRAFFSSLSSISIWNMSPRPLCRASVRHFLCKATVRHFCRARRFSAQLDVYLQIFVGHIQFHLCATILMRKLTKQTMNQTKRRTRHFFPDVWRSFSSDAIEAHKQWKNFFVRNSAKLVKAISSSSSEIR